MDFMFTKSLMMKMMMSYLSSQRVRGGFVGGEEGTGQLRLVGERGRTRGGEVPPDPWSSRTSEV